MEESIQSQTSHNIIFDAFVRNERNKEIFDTLLPDYKVVFFNLPKEKSIERLLGRMYDNETQETFPSGVLINPKN
jgi:adenylate kinase family enzyme